jgi:hypothetical protein
MHRGHEKLIETFSWKRLIGISGIDGILLKLNLKTQDVMRTLI